LAAIAGSLHLLEVVEVFGDLVQAELVEFAGRKAVEGEERLQAG
jgi:hypothetical protein